MIELSIAEAWNAIPGFEKIFWYVALPFTFFGFLTVISALFGLGSGGADADLDIDIIDAPDMDTDVDISAAEAIEGTSMFAYFSVKNMIMFFAVFGWIGIVCARAGFPKFWTALVAVLAGIIAATIFALIFRLLYKLGESGTITSYASTVGTVGKVYLPIPAERGGTGKVQIIVHSSLREIDAITDGDELPTGVQVKVTKLLGKSTLIVEKV